jgi:glycosyltransferase involved in cell wall biosynthesis
MKYSVVIPVYGSENILDNTIQRSVSFFEGQGWDYELVMVNDGSPDNSWPKLKSHAEKNPHIVAINLLKNYGQHNALYCGFHHVSGDYIVTIDDDLQNPPEEIAHLAAKIQEGYDIVYGKFRHKQHAGYRRLGSKIVEQLNRRIFGQPSDLTVTNFRMMKREVVDRIVQYQTGYPYITGLSLMFSNSRANVDVEHHPRHSGASGYNFRKIFTLVARIIFNYSSYPLRAVSTLGFITAALAFLLGIYFLLRALVIGYDVPGWATVVVLLAFFNGINTVIISMLSEYVMRLLKQVSMGKPYQISEIVNHHD